MFLLLSQIASWFSLVVHLLFLTPSSARRPDAPRAGHAQRPLTATLLTDLPTNKRPLEQRPE
jgi:hypothetical protein